MEQSFRDDIRNVCQQDKIWTQLHKPIMHLGILHSHGSKKGNPSSLGQFLHRFPPFIRRAEDSDHILPLLDQALQYFLPKRTLANDYDSHFFAPA